MPKANPAPRASPKTCGLNRTAIQSRQCDIQVLMEGIKARQAKKEKPQGSPRSAPKADLLGRQTYQTVSQTHETTSDVEQVGKRISSTLSSSFCLQKSLKSPLKYTGSQWWGLDKWLIKRSPQSGGPKQQQIRNVKARTRRSSVFP